MTGDTDPPTLFSLKHLAFECTPSGFIRLILALAIIALASDVQIRTTVLATLAVLTLMDVQKFYRCKYHHEVFLRRFGAVYEGVLRDKLDEYGVKGLIKSWLSVELELKRRTGRKDLRDVFEADAADR